MTDIKEDNVLEKILSDVRSRLDSQELATRGHASYQRKIKFSHLLELDPARCKPWKYHDRDTAWLTKENCKDLIDSIQRYGQLEPILVREIEGVPDYDYEIIYGVRRWFACSQIPNQKVTARVTDVEDKISLVLMHTENAASKNITEFERAVSFAQQMKLGFFINQTEMAEMMGLSQGHISKLINAGSIFEHSWIQELFQNKIHIPLRLAYELSMLLKKPMFSEAIKQEANAIHLEKQQSGLLPSSSQVLKRLIKASKLQKAHNENILFKDEHGILAFYLKDKFGKFSLFIEKDAKKCNHATIEKACLEAIRDYLSQ